MDPAKTPIQHVEIPGGLSKFSPGVPTVGLVTNLSPQQMLGFAFQYGIQHLVDTVHPTCPLETKTAEIMLSELDKFFQFPLATVLSPSDVSAKSESGFQKFNKTYCRIDEKHPAIRDIVATVSQWRNSAGFLGEIAMAADELFTNAVFNAPYVTFEKNSRPARTKENGNNPAIKAFRMFVGRSEDHVVLGCEDDYGSMNPTSLLNQVRDCLNQDRENAVKWTSGIGGFGTYMIFRSAESYYAGVRVGRKTVVCCKFPIRAVRMKYVRNIHLSWVKPKD